MCNGVANCEPNASAVSLLADSRLDFASLVALGCELGTAEPEAPWADDGELEPVKGVPLVGGAVVCTPPLVCDSEGVSEALLLAAFVPDVPCATTGGLGGFAGLK